MESTIVREYELKLSSGKVITWSGTSEINAAERYVDCYSDAVVVATRPITHGLYLYNPGHIIIQ